MLRPGARLNLATLTLFMLAITALAACAHQPAPAAQAAPESEPPAPNAEEKPPEEIDVRVLVIAFHGAKGAPETQQRTQAQALERARMLADMVKSGEHLAQLVGTYSDRRGAGDDLGVVRIKTATPEVLGKDVTAAALALPVGGVSDPVPTEEGYVVVERMKDPDHTPTRVAARHILIGYVGSPQAIEGATRTEAEARTLAADIAKRAKASGADWNALAEQYTDEPGGKERHGELGAFSKGQMVPAFEKAAFALQVGEISDVVQSPFGFHVIQRYE